MDMSRHFNPRFWRDNYIDDLDPSEKLLFIHTFTNPEARMCGISEIPKRLIVSDTGFSKEMLEKLFERLEKDKKALYYEGWLCTLRTIKHQNITNGNTRKGIERELSEVPEKIMSHFLESGTNEFRDLMMEFGIEVPTYSESVDIGKAEKAVTVVVKKKKKETVVPMRYPDWLNKLAWGEWIEYRSKEKRKRVTDSARKKQWTLLEKYSEEDQQSIINNSIQNDYQGLFDLKSGGATNKKNFHVA